MGFVVLFVVFAAFVIVVVLALVHLSAAEKAAKSKPPPREMAGAPLASPSAPSRKGVLDQHFRLLGTIEHNYKARQRDPRALERAVAACLEQIELAPAAAAAFRKEYKGSGLPSHLGFTKLAIIREKGGDHAGALELCREALAQGWSGDWEKRIERLSKRLGRSAGG